MRQKISAATATLVVAVSLPVLVAAPVGAAPTTFSVTTTADSGPGSLRQALLDANANPGIDTITFDLPAPGPWLIQPASALPTVTDDVTIGGTTAPGFAGRPLVELNGAPISANVAIGLPVAASITLRGLSFTSWNTGVQLANHQAGALSSSVIESNWFGISPGGTPGHMFSALELPSPAPSAGPTRVGSR